MSTYAIWVTEHYLPDTINAPKDRWMLDAHGRDVETYPTPEDARVAAAALRARHSGPYRLNPGERARPNYTVRRYRRSETR